MSDAMPPYVRAGRVIRFLAWLSLAAMAFVSIAIVIAVFSGKMADASPWPLVIPIVLMVGVTVLQFKLGTAIKEHKDWGRIVGCVWAALQLLGFPIGTIIGAYILWCLIKGWDEQPAAA